MRGHDGGKHDTPGEDEVEIGVENVVITLEAYRVKRERVEKDTEEGHTYDEEVIEYLFIHII